MEHLQDLDGIQAIGQKKQTIKPKTKPTSPTKHLPKIEPKTQVQKTVHMGNTMTYIQLDATVHQDQYQADEFNNLTLKPITSILAADPNQLGNSFRSPLGGPLGFQPKSFQQNLQGVNNRSEFTLKNRVSMQPSINAQSFQAKRDST